MEAEMKDKIATIVSLEIEQDMLKALNAELLEALQGVMIAMERIHRLEGDSMLWYTEEVDRARTLISKAKGGEMT